MTQTQAHRPEGFTNTAPGLLLLALWVLPLLINPVVALSFDEVYLAPKVLWIYAALLPSALLVLWRYREALRNTRGLLILLAAWIGWLILSTLLNRAGWPGWWGTSDRADGMLMHLIYAVLLLAGFAWMRSNSEAPLLLGRTILLGGALLAVTSILQQVGLMGVPGEGAMAGVSATPYGGTLGNRGYMGGALALLLPVALATLAAQPRRGWHWLAVVLMTWGWAGSLTRGAWIAGALGLLWLLVWARPRPTFRTWAAVLFGVALSVVTVSVRGEGRAFNLSSDSNGTGQAIADSSGRRVLWQSALFGISKRPLFGWGTPALWQAMNERPVNELLEDTGQESPAKAEHPNPASMQAHHFVVTHLNVEREQTRNKPLASERQTGLRQDEPANVKRLNAAPTEAPRFLVIHPGGKRELVVLPINKVHNEYLDYALTYGLPAALLFTALVATALWSSRTFLPGISAGLLAYAAYLLTWPEIIRFAPLAWFMMGIALATQHKRRRDSRT
ncbi:hypothetical protein DAETH_26830 [Deinococcus aetherius]|uniref:O-antigen ligase-related domain-containing protein n=1 Tax=Deinococcus aetherius TaxID=200252 RepID=A0ABM8AFY0_9DEIO|nr:O-antigen ligase family protein [Deinococcus aetherius]BDP42714.1 hypothetical protein DAETH_26830 [Deinococcus aetherius]